MTIYYLGLNLQNKINSRNGMIYISIILLTIFNTLPIAIAKSQPTFDTKTTTSSFQKAIDAYNKKDFKPAIDLLLKAYKENPKNSNILLYLGNCYFSLNQKNYGLETYWTLIKNFPSTPNAKQAVAYIHLIAPEFLETHQLPPSLKINTGPVSESEVQKPKGAEKEYVADDLITVMKRTGDRQDCSQQLVSSLKDTFNHFPKGVRYFLGSQGCKIYITPSTIEIDPRLQNTRPGGYEDGSTWKNCPGYTHGKKIIICTTVMAHDESGWVPSDDPISTFRHEVGHEIDYLLGEISQLEAYKHCFLLDVGNMDDDTRQQLAYYTQKADAGPSESFAEITCTILGGGSTKERIEKQKLIKQVFPLSTKYICELLQNPNLGK